MTFGTDHYPSIFAPIFHGPLVPGPEPTVAGSGSWFGWHDRSVEITGERGSDQAGDVGLRPKDERYKNSSGALAVRGHLDRLNWRRKWLAGSQWRPQESLPPSTVIAEIRIGVGACDS